MAGKVSLASTVPFPKRHSDGTGRDHYMGITRPPTTGKVFNIKAPPSAAQPICGRTDPMPSYPFSGSGRDMYMRGDTGGPIPATGKSSFGARPPVSPVNAIRSRTDTMPRYQNDGTGRDIYLSTHLTKIPATGKVTYSNRPPSCAASSKAFVRTDMLPPFTPSGSGRDMFHRVDYREKPVEWDLRNYPCTQNDMFSSSLRATSPLTGARGLRAIEERKKQFQASARLSTPKENRRSDVMVSTGLLLAGSYLRSPD